MRTSLASTQTPVAFAVPKELGGSQLSSALSLPEQSLKYDIYRMRMAQVKVLQARGYVIPEELTYLLSRETRDREKFAKFLERWNEEGHLDNDVYYYYDIFGMHGHSASDDLHSFLCDAETVGIVIVQMVRQTVVASANPQASLKLQIISTDEYKGELIYSGMQIEVLPYQRIYIDPTMHYKAASRYEVLPVSEATALLSSPKMRGAMFPHMGILDPLSLYMGMDKGDVLRLYNNSTCSGLTTSRVLYRSVVDT